jgi:hypothetical protein
VLRVTKAKTKTALGRSSASKSGSDRNTGALAKKIDPLRKSLGEHWHNPQFDRPKKRGGYWKLQ